MLYKWEAYFGSVFWLLLCDCYYLYKMWSLFQNFQGNAYLTQYVLEQVGNRKLLMESGIDIATEVENFVVELEKSAKTGILVAYDDVLTGVLGVADPLKREASVVIEGLHKMGVIPVMVTGDNWRTARAVAKEVCTYLYNFPFDWLLKLVVVITLSVVSRLFSYAS